jgi:UDP-N-acetylglucosamine transferase subunit ALG13
VIVVTVGSSNFQFDRLVRGIEAVETDEEILVQHGPSSVRPKHATCVPYLAFDELVDAVREARVVITHAGVGSVLVAQMNGKKPIVVPRLARYGEVVDDHQLYFAERLARDDAVTLVSDPAELTHALQLPNDGAPSPRDAGKSLEADLRLYLQSVCG